MNRCSVWKWITSTCGCFTRISVSKIPTGFSPKVARWKLCRKPKKAGKIRFMGFTGHKDPSVHLRLLEMADKHGFSFDTAQMPLNVMDAHFRSFGKEVVPVLVKKHIGILGMKPMGDGNILKAKVVTPLECLQYALSLPTSVVITGVDSMEILDQAFEAAKTYSSLSKT